MVENALNLEVPVVLTIQQESTQKTILPLLGHKMPQEIQSVLVCGSPREGRRQHLQAVPVENGNDSFVGAAFVTCLLDAWIASPRGQAVEATLASDWPLRGSFDATLQGSGNTGDQLSHSTCSLSIHLAICLPLKRHRAAQELRYELFD